MTERAETILEFIASRCLENQIALMTVIQTIDAIPEDLRLNHYDAAVKASYEWQKIMGLSGDPTDPINQPVEAQKKHLHDLLRAKRLIDQDND